MASFRRQIRDENGFLEGAIAIRYNGGLGVLGTSTEGVLGGDFPTGLAPGRSSVVSVGLMAGTPKRSIPHMCANSKALCDRARTGRKDRPPTPRGMNAAAPAALLAVWACGAFAAEPRGVRVPAAGPDQLGGYASSHIIVRCASRGGERVQTATGQLQGMGARLGVRHCRPAYGHGFKDPILAAELGLDRTFVIEVPPGTDAVTLAAAFAGREGIESVELDGIGGVVGVFPNDPDFEIQWGMENTGLRVPPSAPLPGVVDCDIDAREAWAIHDGTQRPVVVAVIDSGIDPHPELADRLVPGINTNDPDNPDLTTTERPPGAAPDDPRCPHGMHVAGIIAAAGNNGAGVAGMNWGALLMPVRVVHGGCSGTELQTANGIIWAVDHGAEITNVSLQFYVGTNVLQNAVRYAHARGVLVVAAVGNQRGRTVAFPARVQEAIAVSAIRNTYQRWPPSNYGPETDLCAPGEYVWSTWTTDDEFTYAYLSGTSMATPHVAGLAALLKSFRPNLTNIQIRSILESTAVDVGALGWDEYFGHGLINAGRALRAAAQFVKIIGSQPPDGTVDARQPSELDGSGMAGWQAIEVVLDGDLAGLAPEDFTVSKEGGSAEIPVVKAVAPVASDMVVLSLDRPLEPVSRTTITHMESGTSIVLGYLPGDVDGDGTSNTTDALVLVDTLAGDGSPLPDWSSDIDRSRMVNPQDLARLLDLANGAQTYPAYRDVSLP